MATDAIKSAMETQMKNLEAKTGRKLDEWFRIVNESQNGRMRHTGGERAAKRQMVIDRTDVV